MGALQGFGHMVMSMYRWSTELSPLTCGELHRPRVLLSIIIYLAVVLTQQAVRFVIAATDGHLYAADARLPDTTRLASYAHHSWLSRRHFKYIVVDLQVVEANKR
jgi:hypothetical protein